MKIENAASCMGKIGGRSKSPKKLEAIKHNAKKPHKYPETRKKRKKK